MAAASLVVTNMHSHSPSHVTSVISHGKKAAPGTQKRLEQLTEDFWKKEYDGIQHEAKQYHFHPQKGQGKLEEKPQWSESLQMFYLPSYGLH
jgi:hypothetical protein